MTKEEKATGLHLPDTHFDHRHTFSQTVCSGSLMVMVLMYTHMLSNKTPINFEVGNQMHETILGILDGLQLFDCCFDNGS